MGKEKSNQHKINKLEKRQLKNINNPEEIKRIQGRIDALKKGK